MKFKRKPVSYPKTKEANALAALFNDGRFEQLEMAAKSMTDKFPHYAFAWKLLGLALHSQAKFVEAVKPMQRASTLVSTDAELQYMLGKVQRDAGLVAEAIKSYRQALSLAPSFLKPYINLGNVLRETGQFVEAAHCYRQALQLKPDNALAHFNLGVNLNEQGNLIDAEAAYRASLEIKPDYFEAYNNLGNIQLAQGRLDEAIASQQQGLAIFPNCVELLNNLGNAHRDAGLLVKAEAIYRHVLKIKPDFAIAYMNLGNVQKDQGHLAEAEASYHRALEIDPDYVDARGNLLLCQNYAACHEVSYCREQACRYGDAVAAKTLLRFHSWNCQTRPQRLRIGLVSGDLRKHPVGYFLEGFLNQLALERIELIAYPTYHHEDEVTARIRSHVAAWKPAYGMSDEALARLIHDDGVNILLDLSGHTAHNRLPVFASKAAPIQVSWLGYFATTGIREMDYLLGDPYVCPSGEEGHFREEIWTLPESYLCFTPPEEAPGVSPLPALTSGHITFGSFNNLTKINNSVIKVWAGVLRAIPGSQLLLKTKQLNDSAMRKYVVDRFSHFGITPNRLLLAGHSSRAEHLAAYGKVDIALDPFPFPGGTTSVECLWMGVPVITRKGDRFLSHIGESIACNAGLGDWVAENDDDYVSKAISKAQDLKYLATLRINLRDRLMASPVFDAATFARNFEAALWGMWRRWEARGEDPGAAP